jgi:type I restriction enzyme, S subunit
VSALDTILGTQPAVWDTAPLASICVVAVGRCRPRRTPSVQGGVPVISPAQIAGGHLHLDGAHRLGPDEAERYRWDAVRPGDLIMTRKGERRRHAMATPEHSRAVVDGSCFTLRVPPDGRLQPEYLDHYLNHPGVQEWLDSRTHRGLVPNLPVDRLRELPVLLPPPVEQSDIVQLYRTMEEQIQTYEQILATTRELRRRLIETLLAVGAGE